MARALSRRSPGPYPRIGFPPTEEDIIALNKFLKRLAEVTRGLPAKHAATHTGGDDSVSGTGTPTEIDFDTEGDEGDRAIGYAPFNHKHPASAELASLAGLAGVTTEEIDGRDTAYTYDPEGAELLSLILLELVQLLDDHLSDG